MATTGTGIILQAWVPPELAEQVRALAEQERRSVSALIRLAIEDWLQQNGSPGKASR